MKELKPSWEDVADIASSIAKMTKKKKYDWIVSLNRGGLMAGVRLSHILGLRHAVLSVQSYTKNGIQKKLVAETGMSMCGGFDRGDRILIVDDIADSGESLVFATQRVRWACPGAKVIDTATLHYKPKSIIEPTYIGKKVDNDIWVVYPWESLEETKKKRKDVTK